jgi:putative ABC transport system substrate-binding protein
MDRREFVASLCCIGILRTSVALGQQIARIYRLGILEAVPATRNVTNLESLRKGLRDLGYVDGQNLLIEYRSADGRAERFPELASELVRLKVDLILSRGTPAAQAVRTATETIPAIMATMGDPSRIVASFARPGGNITGVTTFSTELTAKRIELLKELVPNLSRLGALYNIGNPAAPPEWEETNRVAQALGLHTHLFDVRTQEDLYAAIGRATPQHIDAFVVGADGLTQAHQQTIVDLMAEYKLPAAYPAREFVDAGGLFSYAINYPDLYYKFANLIDQIWRGRKPGDLPVEQPTRFELVINAKNAKLLGLTISPTFLARVDEVIE